MGSEARARLGLFILVVTTLFEFTGLFVPGNFLGPGLLAILIAGAIAMGARRLGIGTLLTLIVSSAALVVYLTFVFANRFTIWGLPTPTAVQEVIDAVQHALDRAAVDFAPVPVRAGYVILMVVGLWAITTLGEIATFRWKRPMLAAIPPIGLFAMLMVVGKSEGASVRAVFFLIALLLYWGLESSHRLRSWGRWVPTWTDIDEDDEPASVTGAIARNMGLVCVILALVAPLFLPALEEGLLAWRTGAGRGDGLGSGSGGSGRIDPFVSIAPGLLDQSDETLFTVSTQRGSYWRLVSTPVFDDDGWRPISVVGQPVEGEDVPEDVPVDAPVDTLAQEITIAGLEGDSLPAAPTPSAIAVEERQGDVRYREGTGDLLLEGGVAENVFYTVTSRVPAFSYNDIQDAPVGDLIDLYTDLPADLSPEVEQLRDSWIEGADTPYDRLVAIQNNLTGTAFEYSTAPAETAVENGDSFDYLEQFLTETRSGYCQQYAYAFATLARSLDYPTRVVVGFLPGAAAQGGGYIVRGTDAHAWPEVYFEDFGWVAFEPTPRRGEGGATAVTPAYTSRDSGGGGPTTDPGRATGELPAPDGQLGARETLEEVQRRARGASGDVLAPGAQQDAEWQRTFGRLVVTLAVLTLLFLAAVPALKSWRIRRLYARAVTNRALGSAAFEEFLIEAAELATPRTLAETAPAYVRRLIRTRPIPKDAAARLAAIYDACQYAPVEPSKQIADQARALAADLRSHLWLNASLWQKAMRLFAPRFGARARPAGSLTGLFR